MKDNQIQVKEKTQKTVVNKKKLTEEKSKNKI